MKNLRKGVIMTNWDKGRCILGIIGHSVWFGTYSDDCQGGNGNRVRTSVLETGQKLNIRLDPVWF